MTQSILLENIKIFHVIRWCPPKVLLIFSCILLTVFLHIQIYKKFTKITHQKIRISMCCQGKTRPQCRSRDVFSAVTHFEWWILYFYGFCWRCSLRLKSYVWCPLLGRICVSFFWHFPEAAIEKWVKIMKLRKFKYLVFILMMGKTFLRLLGGGHLAISHVHVQFWEIQFLQNELPFFGWASF